MHRQNNRFDKFSQRARHVLALAQEEAQRFNHHYIGTEHLLLGLVREEEGVAARVLRDLGVDLTKVRSAIEFMIGRGDRAPIGEIGLTPRARKVIELAVKESRKLGHHTIGTEHLLLGLVRERKGIAAGVLRSMAVDLERVREQTVLELGHGSGVRPSGAAVAAGVHRTRQRIVAWLAGPGLRAQRERLARLARPAPGNPPAGKPSADDVPPDERRDHPGEGQGRR